MTVPAITRSFDMGGVLTSTFDVMGKNFFPFAALAAIGAAPTAAFTMFMTGGNPFGESKLVIPPGTQPLAFFGVFFAGGLISFLLTCILQAALIHGTVVTLNGRRASFGDCLATGVNSFLPVAAIGLLSALGIGLGFILLIVPGIILAIGWSIAVPVRVVERKPVFEVFERSWHLTSGHRWALVGLFVVVGIGSAVFQMLVAPLNGITLGTSTPGGASIVFIAATAIVKILVSMFGATMVGVIYYELRSVKEGIGPEALASVFD